MLTRTLHFVIVFAMLNVTAFAQPPRTISVTGKAETQVMPDVAIIGFAIETVDKSLATAKSKTDAAVAEFSKTLKQLGFKSESITRSSLRISKRYPDDDYSEVWYQVTRTISLTVAVSEVTKILDTAIDTGVNQVEGIEYAISDESKIREKLLAEAVENAKEQAAYLAKAFESKLGKARQIHADRNGGSNLVLALRAPADSDEGAVYTPEPITVSRSVDVVFELVD